MFVQVAVVSNVLCSLGADLSVLPLNMDAHPSRVQHWALVTGQRMSGVIKDQAQKLMSRGLA